MTKPKAVLREYLYVRPETVDEEVLENFRYLVHPNPNRCRYCEDDSNCEICPNAPRLVYSYLTWDNFIAFPWGNWSKIKSLLLPRYKVKDLRVAPSLPHPIRFTGKLRSYQKRGVQSWLRHRYGLIRAPARSGKTVMAVYIASKLGLRTLILAHREDLLIQFEEAFYRFTDLEEVQRYLGYLLLARSSSKHFDQAPIGLATFQYFIRSPERLTEARKRYGLIVVDESHHVPANWFSKVTGSFAARYRLGLTATPQRKDGMEVLLFDLIGPVTSEVTPPSLGAKVVIIPTRRDPGKFFYWNTFLSRLARDSVRNKLIVKYIEKDHKLGRSILVVCYRRFHVDELGKLLQQKRIPFVTLTGGVNAKVRAKVLDKLRSREVRVTIATRGVVQEGIDCPAWDTIHWITPSANPPAIYQEVSRIRTPAPGKKEPLVRYFLDNCKAAFACFRVAQKVFKQEGFRFLSSGRSSHHGTVTRRRYLSFED